ncbi:MAG: hypothetical protein JSS00_15625 [Proteobacteria bacterium]|nr:hypothetical protein [Pseudomonadota bacterium]
MTGLARSIFDVLPGAWSLSRQIDDARFGAGDFSGTASFTAHGEDALLYREQGVLRLGAWRGPAWRQWLYSLEGDALLVRYPGTLAGLHVFKFADAAIARHTHQCGGDRYDAEFGVAPDGSLSLTYAVSGPAKDYRLRTLLRRA